MLDKKSSYNPCVKSTIEWKKQGFQLGWVPIQITYNELLVHSDSPETTDRRLAKRREVKLNTPKYYSKTDPIRAVTVRFRHWLCGIWAIRNCYFLFLKKKSHILVLEKWEKKLFQHGQVNQWARLTSHRVKDSHTFLKRIIIYSILFFNAFKAWNFI